MRSFMKLSPNCSDSRPTARGQRQEIRRRWLGRPEKGRDVFGGVGRAVGGATGKFVGGPLRNRWPLKCTPPGLLLPPKAIATGPNAILPNDALRHGVGSSEPSSRRELALWKGVRWSLRHSGQEPIQRACSGVLMTAQTPASADGGSDSRGGSPESSAPFRFCYFQSLAFFRTASKNALSAPL